MSEPRYTCPKCNMVEYCRDAYGHPRYPEKTLRVFEKRHKKTACDGNPVYTAGLIVTKREVCGQC